MKKQIIIAAMLAAAGLAGAQMFAQLFGGAVGTPIPAVAWYKLDGNALDSSGNGYNGTWVGTAAYSGGKFAGTQAGSFTGANHVNCGSLLGVSQSNTVTVTAWIKAANNAQYCVIFGNLVVGTGAQNRGYIVQYDGTGTKLKTRIDTTPNVAQEKNVIPSFSTNNEWQHIAIRISGGVVTGWVNGQQQTSITYTQANGFGTTNPFLIMAYSGNTFRAVGLTQDVRVYNRALSAANIAKIMTGQDVAPIEELQ